MSFASHVLIATDFSEHAAIAYGPAAEIAGRFRGRLTLVHVRDTELPVPAARGGRLETDEEADADRERMLVKLCKEHFRKVSKTECVVLESGDVAQAICSWAKDHDVDLIVVGHQGISGLARLLVGSVAESVMRNATCPVLIVRAHP